MVLAHLSNEPTNDPRDVVNAAMYFYLADPDESRGDGYDLSCGSDSMELARDTREAMEGGLPR